MTALRTARWGVFAAGSLMGAGGAFAEVIGAPTPGQIGLQEPVTEVARQISVFHNAWLMPVITIISLFVLGLLAYVVWKFNEKANPTPSKTTHNTLIEVLWTVIPVMILVVIAVPSFKLLTLELTIPPSDVAIKVTAHQWYWSYGYPKEAGGFAFDSALRDVKQDDPAKGEFRLLSVDNEVVVPVNKTVLLQVTSTDVIHSFVIQSFGIRIDAVPGRLNETWFKAEKEGLYFGQCSKLCGQDHAFMPIAFRVVSQEKYDAWLQDAKKKFALGDGGSAVAVADETLAR
jgi:cytochrome c oxidase subunit II